MVIAKDRPHRRAHAENRSFDSLLGTLYPKSDSFEGLNGTEQNPDADGRPVAIWNSPGTDETTMRIPNPDPGELLYGNSAPAPGQRPTMSGFVQNYLAQRQLNPQQTYDPKNVMHYFAPGSVAGVVAARPKILGLRSLVRFGAMPDLAQPLVRPCATADGRENNDPPHFPDVPTISNRLEQAGIDSWKISFFTTLPKRTRCCSCSSRAATTSPIGRSRPTARLETVCAYE